ncbi:MAG: kup 1 [Gammaproteobacteria bacterium]|jgi:KUP system potassium uptake protein|nr:kup 1 [Gammaproteobacteria bacterium]
MKTEMAKNQTLMLAALGVAFGDIGTSPLYALKLSLRGVAVSTDNVLGVLSLIFWSLTLIVSFCYLNRFLNVSNDGEGGLALLGLVDKKNKKAYTVFFFLGLIGVGLLLGDAMLMPAISVTSAVEGLGVISSDFTRHILPITILILSGLFFCQHFGIEKIGKAFGPIILVWFVVIAILGLLKVIYHPLVIKAVNPYYAILFFKQNGWSAFILLGSIFLVITGAGSLYANVGQFGKEPIRSSWFYIVFPALVLSYFGQGAFLLEKPSAISNPFYLIAPPWFLFSLLTLAAFTTIIASQAAISASFSLVKEATLLDVFPRLRAVQTSETREGQIYLPQINLVLALGTLLIVLIFKTVYALSGAYGIAINIEMLIMTLLVVYVVHAKWGRPISKLVFSASWVIFIMLAFLASNLFKLASGAWVPLLFSAFCFLIMYTWYRGITFLRQAYYSKKEAISELVTVADKELIRVLEGTEAVFVTNIYDQGGGAFLHYFNLSRSVPEHCVIVSIAIEQVPYVTEQKKFELLESPKGIYHLIFHYGFMEDVNIPQGLASLNQQAVLPFKLNLPDVLYFLEEVSVIVGNDVSTSRLFRWQKDLFIFMFQNTMGSADDLAFFNLPIERTVTIGMSCKV